MRRRSAWLLLILAASCTKAGDAGSRAGAGSVPASFAQYDAGAVPGGPGSGARYSLGRPPSEAEVAAIDSDVGQDGAELPAGSGTVAAGAALFAAQCASCHGTRGEGIASNPRLVGRDSTAEGFHFGRDPALVKTIGNYWPYATTVFDYVKRAMPLAAPGSLSDDEVYALTAYLLAANGVIAWDARLDAASLREVRMPYRDRFVPDDRRFGAEVK